MCETLIEDELELMKRALVQVLRNQEAIMLHLHRLPFLKGTTGGATILPTGLPLIQTQELLAEWKDA